MSGLPACKKAMTPFPYSADVSTSVKAAEQLMQEHDVRHLPVKDGHDLAGILTDRDLERARGGGAEIGGLKVGDIYNRNVLIEDLETPLDHVLSAMADRHVTCALIVKDERLAGIFTTSDACRRYAELLRSVFKGPGGHQAA